MSFNSDFERKFMERSLELVKEYQGPYDATLLLNCLLGLLIVPKEACIKSIPKDPIEGVGKWGISPNSIKSHGKSFGLDDDAKDIRGLVWHLRNAIAHYHFKPIPEKGEVEAFHFHDDRGFVAEVKLEELRVFVEKLATKLKEM
jgi:HEPN family protein